jgi:FMN reductase
VSGGKQGGLAVVIGAATPPGRLARAAQTLAELARADRLEFTVEVVDLATAPVELCDGRPDDAYGATTRATVGAIGAAHAVVFAAPVYRASYPGVLKNLLDLLPVEALRGKPVGIVAMGASQHHYLGVDTQLRAVLAWFGALMAPTSVYLTSADFESGRLVSPAALDELRALTDTVLTLAERLANAPLGPDPLAARAHR